MERARVPDAAAFRAFRQRCQDGSWQRDRGGLAVSLQLPPPGCAVHQLKCRIDVPDVPAETMYDVLHDSEYRREWDSNVIDTHDIAQVAANADVGYYAWRCPKPLKNRDVVMLRAWQVEDGYHTIINFSIKHPKYPPRKDLMLKKLHKACVQYPAWKQQHNINMKPWLYPEQNKLPVLELSELALQRAASLENIDESSLAEEKDESSEHSGLEN